MGIFLDKTVNLLNGHYAFLSLAWQMLNLFVWAFLYKNGVPLPLVFCCTSLMFILRLVFRPLSLHLIHKVGTKKILIIGTFLLALPNLLIIPVKGLDWWLLIYIAVTALSDVFYWLSYHNFFAAAGKIEQRGQAIGTREAASKIICIIGPALSGSLLAFKGASAAFGLATFFMFVSALPLFFIKDIEKPKKPTKLERKNISKTGLKFFIVMALLQMGSAWPIIMFMLLNSDYGTYGWLLSLAAFFMAITSIFLGKKIDAGKGTAIYRTAIILLLIVCLGRALFAYDIKTIVFFDIINVIAWCFYTPASMTVIYNLSKKSDNTLYFQYYSEIGWDIGTISGTLICALLAYLDINLRWSLAASALGTIATGYGLYKYYEVKPSNIRLS